MEKSTTAMTNERPFNPSWIDRFNNWVKNLPLQAWVFFLILGLGLVLVQILFLLLEGGLSGLDLLPVIIFNGLFVPFLLGLIYLLDDQAQTALKTMRPVLETTDAEFERYR